MKRRTSNMIASVLSVATLGMQALPICAESVGQATIEVNTVQDFLNEYLSTKEEFIDENGSVSVSYTPITYVDDTNYWMVLSAKNFYDSLSANVVFIVDGEYYVPKSQEQMDKDWALKGAIDEYFAQYDNYFFALVNDAVAKDQEIKAAEELARQEQEALAQQQLVFESIEPTLVEQPKIEAPVEVALEFIPVTGFNGEVEEEVVKEEAAGAAVQKTQELKEMTVSIQNEEIVNKRSVVDVKKEIVQETISAPAAMLIESPELTIEEAAAKPLVEVSKENTSTTAQDFVDTYLTSSSGNIYAQANSVNFQSILNSLSAWNKLSQSDKDQVNSILMNRVGKNYQTLLQEAQTIKYGGAPIGTGPVNTGLRTNASMYALLCGLSAALFGFITKRKEI